jgi:hypothetical protein
VTDAVWASVALGTALGAIAARLRLSQSPLERHRWLIALGAAAGAITATAVVFAVALGAVLIEGGPRSTASLLGPTCLVLLLLFVGFGVRR